MSWKEILSQFLTWDTIRWVFLFPSLIVVWHAVLLAGMVFASTLVNLCEPTDLVSGNCIAPWYDRAMRGLVIIFSGISAVAVVATSFLMAPRFKPQVTWAVYLCGSIAAIIVAFLGNALWECLAAIGSGWLATRLCVGSGTRNTMPPN